MTISPIETVYNGYRFRSRLEARWAVFFTVKGIVYEYEPEGFNLGDDLGWYLPDFWLPQVSMWAEVKRGPFAPLEKAKCQALARQTDYPCLMLDGPPAVRNYWAYQGIELVDIDGECWQFPELTDYLLCEGHRYWLTENRFFRATGAEDWEINLSDEYDEAVEAARQARFESRDEKARR